MFEFHISRQARDRYQFDQSLFTLQGNVIFANFHATRQFAQKMNAARDLVSFPEQAMRAGQLNAMGLIDEILHLVVSIYRRDKNPAAMTSALSWLEDHLSKKELDKALLQFVVEFPPIAVYRKQITPTDYLQQTTEGVTNRSLALEEMLMLWVANKNPAFEPFQELFNDDHLASDTAYLRLMKELHQFFETQPHFGPDSQNLIDMLRQPAINVPNSLTGQLDYVRTYWSELLGKYLYRLLSSLDFVREEEKMSFAGGGPGPVLIPVYDRATMSTEAEPEKFSQDREWMPRLVLMAKNSFVWLDQLSKKYRQPINRLDQIPDEELDVLAQRGFTGLWLIGLWERSSASALIKQLCGNSEAIASAYSLASYSIAYDLGGEEAYQNLRDRAWQRGIRLASDMVPNHMGIDSGWVIEHPDWFVSLDYCPYPSYSFNGPDLSPVPGISINIEDHYFDRTDAAVVFKRYDHSNGNTRFIYHGNDGTTMPWNDTAQLNYLDPQVREAVIQTILEVARKFPIIRFDAAMTLAKRHFQRLWYPEPGSGGAIPSRAEHGLTKDQFEQAIPVEFWREVVDRAAVEAPDTLLLAEAFWLMEGYFVRTLGMHRVYNSAFMNLLRNEDNAKYRTVMKNTLEFDPEIMKRFVNFMNNPDERTAVDQFGKGDKYFGICTLLSTLPGLPMFGHGQIEGFSEKYGMEFRRAYWEEVVDENLVDRHNREITPLLHRRALFAGVENFLLYNFYTPEGSLNEDVYAYSNGIGSERALVVFHNRFADARGFVRISVPFSVKTGGSDQRSLTQKTLADGLNLHAGANSFVIFKDQTSHLEYIRPAGELIHDGLFIDLHAYEYHVFMDFRQIEDDAWQSYLQLSRYLGGRGVPDISEALHALVLQPVLEPFHQLANPAYWQYLLSHQLTISNLVVYPNLLTEAGQKLSNLKAGILYLNPGLSGDADLGAALTQSLSAILALPVLQKKIALPGSKLLGKALDYVSDGLELDSKRWSVLFAWSFLRGLGKLNPINEDNSQILSWMDEWQLNKALLDSYQSSGMDVSNARKSVLLLRLLVLQQHWYRASARLPMVAIVEQWLAMDEVRSLINLNRYQDILWFNQEAFDELLWWMMALAMIEELADQESTTTQLIENLLVVFELIQRIKKAAKGSEYQVNKLLALLKSV